MDIESRGMPSTEEPLRLGSTQHQEESMNDIQCASQDSTDITEDSRIKRIDLDEGSTSPSSSVKSAVELSDKLAECLEMWESLSPRQSRKLTPARPQPVAEKENNHGQDGQSPWWSISEAHISEKNPHSHDEKEKDIDGPFLDNNGGSESLSVSSLQSRQSSPSSIPEQDPSTEIDRHRLECNIAKTPTTVICPHMALSAGNDIASPPSASSFRKMTNNASSPPATRPLPRVALLASPTNRLTKQEPFSKSYINAKDGQKPVPDYLRTVQSKASCRSFSPESDKGDSPRRPSSQRFPRSLIHSSPVQKKKKSPPVVNESCQYDSHFHDAMGPCDRCWSKASPRDRKRYQERGSHLCIAKTRGGYSIGSLTQGHLNTCQFHSSNRSGIEHKAESKDKHSVRLCRQCFVTSTQRTPTRKSPLARHHLKHS